jgi:hypothetical protein
MDARWFMLLAVGLTVVLYLVPYGQYLAYPLVLLSTLAHEMGHGLAAALVGASFESLKMYADGSGMASIAQPGSRLASALISAGGLVGPAVAAAFLFVASARPKVARFALIALSVFLIGACVIVVRNAFGLAFILTIALAAFGIGWKASPRVAQIVSAFVAVQLALSVFSRGDYLFTDVAQTATGARPSDVAHMAAALFLPYWFWGAVCGLFSIAVLVIGMWVFWRASGEAPREAHR